LKTKKGKNLQRTDEIRQERAKARPPVWAKISTRAYEDDNHLNLCVKKLIRAYQQRISDGRSFPKMAEMSVNMEVVIPYGYVFSQLNKNKSPKIIFFVRFFSCFLKGFQFYLKVSSL
jgi:glycopeptide antibiotics resistance protein